MKKEIEIEPENKKRTKSFNLKHFFIEEFGKKILVVKKANKKKNNL
jgi:hypothetical protein